MECAIDQSSWNESEYAVVLDQPSAK